MNLEEDFICLSCGAKGHDIMSFVMQLDFVSAVKRLGCWDESCSISAREWLHPLERVYRTRSERLTKLYYGAAEKQGGEAEVLRYILSASLPHLRTAVSDYRQAARAAYGN